MKMNFIVANFWCYSWTPNVCNDVNLCDKSSWTNVQRMNQLSSCKFLYVLAFFLFQLALQPAPNPTNRFIFIYILFWMIFL